MTDIVIPLGGSCGWGHYEELRYALRSADQYVGDLRSAYILGPQKPEWLKAECFIHHPDPYRSNKDANLIQKVLRACMIPELSERFIRMSDDQLFLAPWIPTLYYLEPLHSEMYLRTPRKWYKRLENTNKSLGKLPKPLYNFDSHVPMEYDKSIFVAVMTQYDYGASPGMCINTLYANHISSRRKKLPKGARMGISGPASLQELDKQAKNAIFCNYVDGGLSSTFKSWVKKRFPQKTRFEN